jgi:hypothetical protein
VAEVQALLHDHVECGKHSAADMVAKAQAVLSESELLRAMLDVGYFPPNNKAPRRRFEKRTTPTFRPFPFVISKAQCSSPRLYQWRRSSISRAIILGCSRATLSPASTSPSGSGITLRPRTTMLKKYRGILGGYSRRNRSVHPRVIKSKGLKLSSHAVPARSVPQPLPGANAGVYLRPAERASNLLMLRLRPRY